MELTVRVSDAGDVSFLDGDGHPVSEQIIALAKRQQGEKIKALIQQKCDEINGYLESVAHIHLHTPEPGVPQFEVHELDERPPLKPEPKRLGFLASLFKSQRMRLEQENSNQDRLYLESLKRWEERKTGFEAEEATRKRLFDDALAGEASAMAVYLEQRLQEIHWPRETNVSLEIDESGGAVALDVDLPEIEDMPDKVASAPARGYRLTVKEISRTQVQKRYMAHVHGIGFRIIGEAFASLPTVQQVTLSAYSQRSDSATGAVRDDYLYSVRAKRPDWERINFNNLADIDVVEALERFELRRDTTKTGVFRPIVPFGPGGG